MKNLAPLLVNTAYHFAQHTKREEMLENETTSEFIVQLLEILIVLSGEQAYFEVFIEN